MTTQVTSADIVIGMALFAALIAIEFVAIAIGYFQGYQWGYRQGRRWGLMNMKRPGQDDDDIRAFPNYPDCLSEKLWRSIDRRAKRRTKNEKVL